MNTDAHPESLLLTRLRTGMKIWTLGLLMLAFGSAMGQFTETCVDTNRIDPFYQCNFGPAFDPVCACNAKTYANECVALNRAAAQFVVHGGVCQNELYFVEIWPNPVGRSMQFYMQYADRQEQAASMTIFDAFGNQVYFRLFSRIPSDIPYQESLDMSGLRTGVYVVLIQGGGKYTVKKFLKHSI